MDKMTITHLEPDEVIVAIGTRDIGNYLTYGKGYIALNGLEKGIFLNRPYVTIILDNGKPFTCHASRFVKASLFHEWESLYRNPLK